MRLPTTKNEINWGTVVPVGITILVLGAGMMFYVRDGLINNANATKSVDEKFAAYIATHAEMHKDATALRTGELARLDERLKTVESANAHFRLTNLEAMWQNTAASMSEIKEQVTSVQSDIRLSNQKAEAMERKMDQMLNILTGGLPLPTTPRQQ